MTTTLRRVAAGALLSLTLCVTLGGASARAQLTTDQPGVSVSLPQYGTVERTLTLTNTGSEALTFCVNFDRPLQREGSAVRLSEQVGAAPCGTYGEVLYRFDEEDFGAAWSPYGITMTPEGRLFTAESSGFPWRTFEFTGDLQLLRFFEHPHVAELTPFAATLGLTFDAESETLWWMNRERTGGSNAQTRRILLLEGDLDGEPTGRRIEVAPPDAPIDTFNPGGLAYDIAADRFYFSATLGDRQDPDNWRLWAVDRDGSVPEGYPLRPEPYPDGIFGIPDAHGGAEGGPGGTPGAEGVRIEYGAYLPFGPGNDRIVVVDRWGQSEGEALETPVPSVLFEAGGAGVRGNPLRSRMDPNGVMYMTFRNFDTRGIVGVRPHPLPPSWLVVDSDAGPEAAWDGTLAPGESRTVELTFRAGARAVGDYTAVLQAFEAESGEAVEVPLALTVMEGTDAEEGTEAPARSSLAVYPNPASGAAVVALTLGAVSDVRVAVYDVLGRRVASLAEGRFEVGTHRLAFDGSALPAGLYVVRAEGGERMATARLTLVR